MFRQSKVFSSSFKMMSSKILRSFARPASGVTSIARSSVLSSAASLFAAPKASVSAAAARASMPQAAPTAQVSATNWKINVPSPVPPPGDLPALRVKASKETDRLAEVIQAKKFSAWLASQPAAAVDPAAVARVAESKLSNDDLKVALKAAMMTFLLHVEVRPFIQPLFMRLFSFSLPPPPPEYSLTHIISPKSPSLPVSRLVCPRSGVLHHRPLRRGAHGCPRPRCP